MIHIHYVLAKEITIVDQKKAMLDNNDKFSMNKKSMYTCDIPKKN